MRRSVYYLVGLLAEIPSGMAADLFGRKKTLIFGGVLVVAYNLLMAFAPNLFVICLAMALNALSNAMFSGTSSALTYDSLKQAGAGLILLGSTVALSGLLLWKQN